MEGHINPGWKALLTLSLYRGLARLKAKNWGKSAQRFSPMKQQVSLVRRRTSHQTATAKVTASTGPLPRRDWALA